MRIILLLWAVMFIFISCSQAASVCFKDKCVDVQVVSTRKDLMKGLQGRERLDASQGMLFVFQKEDLHGFWMQGMKIAIDMLWLDQNGKIVSIAPSRQPCKQDPCEVYSPSQKSLYVLEAVDGFALEHELKVGDTLQLKDIH